MKPLVETSWLDKTACAISPKWGEARIRNKLRIAAYSSAGYVTPGSRRKSMKGITSTANSPDEDIIEKLPEIRGLSRDLAMNSPLAISILRRHRTDIVNAGLQLQAAMQREVLKEVGVTSEQVDKIERQAEIEFDTWAESFFCHWSEELVFGELQGVGIFNTMLSGDCWVQTLYDEPRDSSHPYGTRINLIDADLVRDPIGGSGNVDIDVGSLDIKDGVEKDEKGRISAIYVWDTYPNDAYNDAKRRQATWKRVSIYTEKGRRQIWPLFDCERIGQRRGVSLYAPAFETLKQLTRLSEAQLMNALVSAFFSVFVKDTSGLGMTMGAAMTPEETLFGGGTYGPNEAESEPVNQEDGNDLEMGSGNINYLDDETDISIADPKKVDTGFEAFWNALANQICAAGGIPLEKAMLKYTTSYTAARAALIDSWKNISNWRKILERRLCKPAYEAFFEEAVLKGTIDAPYFFDSPRIRRAYLNSRWVGIGMGALDPLKESKASLFDLRTTITTREDEYQKRKGGRWEDALDRYAREEELIAAKLPNKSEEVVVDETVSTQDEE